MTMSQSKAQESGSRTGRALSAIQEQLDKFCASIPALAELEAKIAQRTASPLLDWVDALHLIAEPQRRCKWIELGWLPSASSPDHEVLRFEGDELPPIVLHTGLTARLDLRVQSLESFLATHGLAFNARIQGSPGSPLRRAAWGQNGLRTFGVVERRGTFEFDPRRCEALDPARLEHWAQMLRGRARCHSDDAKGLDELGRVLDQAVAELGEGPVASLFLSTEREYWQWRNQAARIQFRRQQGLGLGWGNHGKHIYRCSEELFEATQALFAKLGFVYKGDDDRQEHVRRLELAHPFSASRIVLETYLGELGGSDPHSPGMWTALHGESLMQAGMHRLCAVQHRARAGDCVGEGETWSVDPQRVRGLLRAGRISAEVAEELIERGAAGSELSAKRA